MTKKGSCGSHSDLTSGSGERGDRDEATLEVDTSLKYPARPLPFASRMCGGGKGHCVEKQTYAVAEAIPSFGIRTSRTAAWDIDGPPYPSPRVCCADFLPLRVVIVRSVRSGPLQPRWTWQNLVVYEKGRPPQLFACGEALNCCVRFVSRAAFELAGPGRALVRFVEVFCRLGTPKTAGMVRRTSVP
jgi:hypothetical protein